MRTRTGSPNPRRARRLPPPCALPGCTRRRGSARTAAARGRAVRRPGQAAPAGRSPGPCPCRR
ncbi:MAG: hypothetical protein FJ109_07505 [Deltaproteobacteria bacterium]|nr:hypothetical protein [Deltaproteobacteria bacterium]